MASASSTSARSLFVESKMRLADRVQVNVNNIASLARQIQRGSKSSDILMHSAKNFAQQEHGLENAETNLKKLTLIVAHLQFQMESLGRSSVILEEVTEQCCAVMKKIQYELLKGLKRDTKKHTMNTHRNLIILYFNGDYNN